MTEELLSRVQAPWYTTEAGSDRERRRRRAIDEQRRVRRDPRGLRRPWRRRDRDERHVLPLLDELGVEVAEVGGRRRPDRRHHRRERGDGRHRRALRGEPASDQVLTVGAVRARLGHRDAELDYRPRLLLTDPNSVLAYTSDPSHDLVGARRRRGRRGSTAGAQDVFELDGMQACIGCLERSRRRGPRAGLARPRRAHPLTAAVHRVPERRPPAVAARGGGRGPELRDTRRGRHRPGGGLCPTSPSPSPTARRPRPTATRRCTSSTGTDGRYHERRVVVRT